jgi:hypothetical protein
MLSFFTFPAVRELPADDPAEDFFDCDVEPTLSTDVERLGSSALLGVVPSPLPGSRSSSYVLHTKNRNEMK